MKQKFEVVKSIANRTAAVIGLSALGIGVALASSGGPFSAMSNFLDQDMMPGVASIGIIGGIGYAAIHAFKHDYGKATVGMGVAAGGGFVVKNSSWFTQQTGISAATIGHHAPLIATALHALGL